MRSTRDPASRAALTLSLAFALVIGGTLVAQAQNRRPDRGKAATPAQVPAKDATQAEGKAATTGAVAPGSFAGGTLPALTRRSTELELLLHPAVQDDLKLTDDQKKKVAGIEKARRQRAANPVPQRSIPAGSDGTFNPEGFDGVDPTAQPGNHLNSEADKAAIAAINPRQRARLAQINLQLDGVMAFAREDVIGRLSLDEAQLEALQGLIQGAEGQMAQVGLLQTLGDGGGNPQVREALDRTAQAGDEVRDATLRQAIKVLHKRQLDAFNKLRGEPFDPAKLRPGGKPGDAPDEAPAKADAVDEAKPKADPEAKADDAAKPPARKGGRDRRPRANPGG